VRLSLPDVRGLLGRLESETADSLESETLEFKAWDPGSTDKAVRDVREAVVCLANARGGTVVLGVQDRKRSRQEAIVGVPPSVDVDRLRRSVYDGTDPHILVDIEELLESEGRLLVVHVPPGLPPHTTADGVGRIRIGKECRPLTGSELLRLRPASRRDLTGEVAEGATLRDLDAEALRALQRTVATDGNKPELARRPLDEVLQALGLVREGGVTVAAILLAGRPAALARWVAQHEVVFLRHRTQTRYDVRLDLRGPLLGVLDRLRELLEAHLHLRSEATAGFGELILPDLTWWAAREAILNALVHRDYFLSGSVLVEIHADRAVVTSPGGFIGGVRPENILRHPPVRRNPFLADVLQQAGLVNRAGLGVDRIYEELLRLGKPVPRYEADEAHVRLTIPTLTHLPFAQFVAEEARAGRVLELDDLLLLRALVDRGTLHRWSAAEALQVGEAEAAEKLVSLREARYVTPRGRGRGTAYQLERRLSDQLRGPEETDRDLPLDQERIRLSLEAILRERGRLTNAEIRRVSGLSRMEVIRLMKRLQADGAVELVGRGRGAHYRALSARPPAKPPARRR
jgi:ATP-dependent DNA helicase RecG